MNSDKLLKTFSKLLKESVCIKYQVPYSDEKAKILSTRYGYSQDVAVIEPKPQGCLLALEITDIDVDMEKFDPEDEQVGTIEVKVSIVELDDSTSDALWVSHISLDVYAFDSSDTEEETVAYRIELTDFIERLDFPFSIF